MCNFQKLYIVTLLLLSQSFLHVVASQLYSEKVFFSIIISFFNTSKFGWLLMETEGSCLRAHLLKLFSTLHIDLVFNFHNLVVISHASYFYWVLIICIQLPGFQDAFTLSFILGPSKCQVLKLYLLLVRYKFCSSFLFFYGPIAEFGRLQKSTEWFVAVGV